MAETTPRLVFRDTTGAETVVEARQGTVLLGLAPDVDVKIPIDAVAPHHAELSWDGSHLVLRDLHSGHTTTVNGRAVVDWVDLRDGDTVTLGLAEGRVEGPGSEPQSAPVPGPAAAPSGKGKSRQVFISHASEDKYKANALATVLKQRGWQPWIDASDIKGGSAWAASIQSAIKDSVAVVLLVSSNSVAKEWVMDEITAARNLRIPIIPALLENVRYPDDLQFLLQRTQSVEIYNMEPAQLNRLDTAIIDLLERQGRTNPDRVKLRIGKVLGFVGSVVLLGGFVWFVLAGFSAVNEGGVGPDFATVLTPFFVFMGGGVIAGIGSSMVRSARSRGL